MKGGPVVWGSCFPDAESTCKECADIIHMHRLFHPERRLCKEDPCVECKINLERIVDGKKGLSYGY